MSIFRNALFMYRGLSEFTKGGYDAAAKSFNPTDLDVDLSGKSFVVTGKKVGMYFSLHLLFPVLCPSLFALSHYFCLPFASLNHS